MEQVQTAGKMLRLIVCLLLCVAGGSAYSQTNKEGKVIVQYDPLFWKHQLKLSNSQSNRIMEINVEYYEKIKVASSGQSSSGNTRHQVEQILEQRSHQIWSTFHSRQKRKWAKMWNESKNG